MIKLEKKQVKFISILIAVVFVGSVVALALTQSGSGIARSVLWTTVRSAASIRSSRRPVQRCRRLRRRHRRILSRSRQT